MSDELVARLLSHDDGLMTEAAVKIAALNGERAAIKEMHDWLNGSLIKEKLENGRLRAENEKLRAALKPFAEPSIWPDGAFPDDMVADSYTFGQKRAAAAALKEMGE